MADYMATHPYYYFGAKKSYNRVLHYTGQNHSKTQGLFRVILGYWAPNNTTL